MPCNGEVLDGSGSRRARISLRTVIVVLTLVTTTLIGPPAGATIPTGTASVSTADAKIVGAVARRELGAVVTGVGDTNGDGYEDVGVMSGLSNFYDPTAYAFLFLGPITGTLQESDADAVLTLAEGMVDLAGAGDVNGDGYDDIIVGSPFSTSSSFVPGAAWIVYGPVSGSVDVEVVGAKLTGEVPGDFAGSSVAGIGDVDGDGFDDVLVGAPSNDAGGSDAGMVYVVRGPVPAGGEDLADAAAKIEGVNAHHGFGKPRAMASAGDVDGDGLGDVIIGDHLTGDAGPGSGAAFVFYGKDLSGTLTRFDAGARILGTAPFDAAGQYVAGVGDVNGDGYDDVAVDAPHNLRIDNVGEGDLDGFIYIIDGPLHGPVSLSGAAARLHGERLLDLGSVWIDGAGDVNSDGFDDVVIGVNNATVGSNFVGITYIEFGPIVGNQELSAADVRLTGEAKEDNLGWSVAGVGDTNGDGIDDVSDRGGRS